MQASAPHPSSIRRAAFPADAESVRELFGEYERVTGQDLCFQGFADELAGLPGAYAEPRGVVLLAANDGGVAGTVALRPQPAAGPDACEMKRLYVRESSRLEGLGRRLCEELLVFARSAGYRRMVLDTLPEFRAALALYHALGFTEAQRFNDDPDPRTLYLARNLT